MRNDKSIYLIQNDGLFFFWLSAVLDERTNYIIHDYYDLEESLDDIEEFKPRYVILKDGPNNKINSQEAILKIKYLSPDTDIIVLTNEEDTDAAIDLLKTGAHNYLTINKESVHRLLEAIS